jgi:hypothetical protein
MTKTDKPGSGASPMPHSPQGMHLCIGAAAQPGGGPNTSTALSPPNANELDIV